MHIELEHVDQSLDISCDNCERRFETLEHLLEHIETSHESAYINCKECEYQCKSQAHLNFHVQGCHSPNLQSFDATQTKAPQAPSDPDIQNHSAARSVSPTTSTDQPKTL